MKKTGFVNIIPLRQKQSSLALDTELSQFFHCECKSQMEKKKQV